MNEIISEKTSGLMTMVALLVTSLFRYFFLTPFIFINTVLLILPFVIIYLGFQDYGLTKWVSDEAIMGGATFIARLFGSSFQPTGTTLSQSNSFASLLWTGYIFLSIIFFVMGALYEKIKKVKNITTPSFKKTFLFLVGGFAVLYGGSVASVFLVNKGVEVQGISWLLFWCFIVAVVNAIIIHTINATYKKIVASLTPLL